jgi:hypothetical protein
MLEAQEVPHVAERPPNGIDSIADRASDSTDGASNNMANSADDAADTSHQVSNGCSHSKAGAKCTDPSLCSFADR